MKKNLDSVADCLQNEPAFCSAICPFHFDIRDFIGKLQKGRFNAAYRAYVNAVGFPETVSAICPEPCKKVCPLNTEGSSAISMRLLEKASIDYARNTEPDSYNLPLKNKKIAIIGGGISGLACALRLATKKYTVTVYEKSNRIGGHLYDLMPKEIFLKDIEKQFKNEEYSLLLNTEVSNLDDISSKADSVYIATGKGGNDFGLSLSKKGAFATSRPGIFMGGSMTGIDTMWAIAEGLNVCTAIERFLKTGNMNQEYESNSTRLKQESIRKTYSLAVLPVDGKTYTQDEAIKESNRCLKCACDACVYYCDLMGYFKKFPKRIAEEVELTINPGTLDGNGTLATRLISTCNQCGLCKNVCPQKIDTGELFLRNHRIMREKGAMPWAFHDFFLRDMDHANNEANLCLLPTGFDKSQYVFFPGCQLGASDPRYVMESYRFLIGIFPDTAIMLNCCGAPSEWAGDQAIFNKVKTEITKNWIKLGKPKAVFACPTCKQMFKKYLPEIEGEFLYNIISEKNLVPDISTKVETASVFDPCASRDEPEVQETIRKLAKNAGMNLEPLPMERERANCCSFGGEVSVAHPPYANFVVKKRIEESFSPYITYCSNCRDIFASAGKSAWHILDLIFGLNNADRVPPRITERKNNRMLLKYQMLKEFWKEENEMEKTKTLLLLSEELKKKINTMLILETDILTVIEHCEKSQLKIFDPDTNSFSGHLLVGNMTYWVQYKIQSDDKFEVVNAYCHRMKIEES